MTPFSRIEVGNTGSNHTAQACEPRNERDFFKDGMS